ncbi:MAG: hypothetical protein HY999_03200 [Nitrospinae bacterium]|nr:hypothetical protein [Nitrospinota bacterium]
MENKKRDRWDKASIILQPVGGFLTALAVGGLGLFGSQFLEQRQTIETNARLYIELMSKREESESALRKDMFKSIIESFLKPGLASTTQAELEAKVLNLELLAYNFHESLNLKPLFIHLKNQIIVSKGKDAEEYMDRLYRITREITKKQMMILEGAGKTFDRTIEVDALTKTAGGVRLDGGTLTLDNIERDFIITVYKADQEKKELRLKLEVKDPSGKEKTQEAEFTVGFFDFPMIDNTRLSHDQRCTIVMTAFGESSADITISYFPGSYASLKEKPYYHEVVESLVKTGKILGEGRI